MVRLGIEGKWERLMSEEGGGRGVKVEVCLLTQNEAVRSCFMLYSLCSTSLQYYHTHWLTTRLQRETHTVTCATQYHSQTQYGH